MYIKKKSKDNEYSYTTLLVEDLIRNKYGYAARITDIWRLLAVSIGLEKFELLEPINSGSTGAVFKGKYKNSKKLFAFKINRFLALCTGVPSCV